MRTLVIALVMIICLGSAAVYLVGDFGTGYKVTLKGNVNYNPLGTIFTINYDGNPTITQDKSVLTTYPMSWWNPLGTGTIIIDAELYGDGMVEDNLGSIDFFENEPFTITLRHVPEGTYSGTFHVYEVTGGIFGLGGEKVLKASEPFTLDVIL